MGDLLILSTLRPVIWAIYFVESLIFSGALNRRSLLLRLELMDCSHSKKTLIGFEEMNFTLFLKIKVSFFRYHLALFVVTFPEFLFSAFLSACFSWDRR